ncbi:hypothetical protein J421_1264 [Gemmatirosa kalamazoonensis]|uniref:Uncharacterized protein n=1 Tax=Gemmatirosa kalamazoonensis TaxID=861299 RepID=W0RDE0_9BACT|nr:hypothetical protein [Gemmatirosa kalamazoonensis]AHG88801.1 hypothetical protein J421_1264 [Gemmatirosa kalamazoonensis]
MRSRQNTVPHPVPGDAAGRATRRAPARGRGGRRRTRAVDLVPHPPLLHGSPEALYRAEKARRAHAPDDAVMIEAKRLYDEAIAETGKKRAGMRSAVVPPSQRRGATAAEPAGEG